MLCRRNRVTVSPSTLNTHTHTCVYVIKFGWFIVQSPKSNVTFFFNLNRFPSNDSFCIDSAYKNGGKSESIFLWEQKPGAIFSASWKRSLKRNFREFHYNLKVFYCYWKERKRTLTTISMFKPNMNFGIQ